MCPTRALEEDVGEAAVPVNRARIGIAPDPSQGLAKHPIGFLAGQRAAVPWTRVAGIRRGVQ